MYIFEFDNCSEFLIISFSGEIIASVKTKEMAETLVFHLNRGVMLHRRVMNELVCLTNWRSPNEIQTHEKEKYNYPDKFP